MLVLTQQDINDYLGGLSSVDLSKRYSVSPGTIINALRRQNITTRPRAESNRTQTFITKQKARKNPRKFILTEEAIQNYNSGMSSPVLAKKLGVSTSAVISALRRQGVYVRTSGETLTKYPNGKPKKPRLTPEELSRVRSAANQGIPLEQWTEFRLDYWKRVLGSAEYKQWRAAVYKRDNYRCVWCGIYPRGHKQLQAHHIYMKSRYRRRIFDVTNGVTLCKSCHDTIRGYEEQLIDVFTAYVLSIP